MALGATRRQGVGGFLRLGVARCVKPNDLALCSGELVLFCVCEGLGERGEVVTVCALRDCHSSRLNDINGTLHIIGNP